MPLQFILQEEIDRWLEEVGLPGTALKSGRSIKIIPPRTRKENLSVLFLRLKEFGATRDFFLGTNKDKIAKACIPTKKSMPSGKWRERYLLVCKDIDYLKTQIFGTASDEYKNGKTEVIIPAEEGEIEECEPEKIEVPIKKIIINPIVNDNEKHEYDPEMCELLGLNLDGTWKETNGIIALDKKEENSKK